MASAAAFDVIEQRLKAEWTATALAFENEAWPDVQAAETPPPFVFVEIFGDYFDQQEIGGGDAPAANTWRESGQVLMHVMTPEGTGSRQARVYAKQLVDIFRGHDIGGVVFRDASIGATERGDKDGQYFRLTASLNWHRDE